MLISRWAASMLVKGRACTAPCAHSTWLCLPSLSVSTASADRARSCCLGDWRAQRHRCHRAAWPLISQRASRTLASASGEAEGQGLALGEPLSSKFDVALRDYQEKIIEDILSNLKAGLTRQLVSLPTGSGKTVVFLALARILNKKTLIIANSIELVAQTEQRLSEVWPGVWAGVVQGRRNVYDRKVVIATVQTASNAKRLQALSEQDFELLIIDEAHHSTANTYMSIMLNLGFLSEADVLSVTGKAWAQAPTESGEHAAPNNTLWRQHSPPATPAVGESTDNETVATANNSLGLEHSSSSSSSTSSSTDASLSSPSPSRSIDSGASSTDASSEGDGAVGSPSMSMASRDGKTKITIGCTATPYRHGKDKLDQVFDTLVQSATLGDLIRAGYLCKIYAERILTYQDISSAVDEEGHLTNSDAELGKAVDTPERNRLVVSAYKSKALEKDGSYRKAIAFCCSLDHAENLAEEFRANGIEAEMVSGNTNKLERARLLEDHKRGRIQVLTNCGVLTEGYDDTSISCVLMTRPTSSSGLYTQCVGRGLRTHPGKEDCMLLDFTDRLHALDKESDLVTSKDVFKGEDNVITLRNYDPEVRNELGREIGMILGGQFELYNRQKYLWVQRHTDHWMAIPIESAQEKRRRFLMKDKGPQPGNMWVHLQHLSTQRPKGKGSKPRSHYCLRVSQPNFNPPLDSPSQWIVLHEFIDIPPTSFEAKVLTPAEKILEAVKVPNLNSMKLANYRQRSGWPSQPVSEKQLQFIEGMRWIPEGTDTSRMTKGQAACIITLGKVDQAARRAASSNDDSWHPVPATDKQKGYLKYLLERHGSNPAVQEALEHEGLRGVLRTAGEGLNKLQASNAIGCIKLYAARNEDDDDA